MVGPRKAEVWLLYDIRREGLVGAEKAGRHMNVFGFCLRAIGSHRKIATRSDVIRPITFPVFDSLEAQN